MRPIAVIGGKPRPCAAVLVGACARDLPPVVRGNGVWARSEPTGEFFTVVVPESGPPRVFPGKPTKVVRPSGCEVYFVS